MVLLVVWLWNLSHLTHLVGTARYVRLAGILLLAGGLICALYYWLGGITQPMPSAHAASHSVWPWAQKHLGLATLLPLAGIAIALGSSPGRWLGALGFTAGVLLTGCLLLIPASLTQQTAPRLAQARQASRTY